MLPDAAKQGYQRYILTIKMHLAGIDLALSNFASAEQLLTESKAKADLYQDRQALVHIQRHFARLHALRGDLPGARASLAEAVDLFERLGMRRELAEAREEMVKLEATIASSALTQA
jgi:hypothetical protein